MQTLSPPQKKKKQKKKTLSPPRWMGYYKGNYWALTPFVWKTRKDQWSEITQIMVNQMNLWILAQSGFIGSFD